MVLLLSFALSHKSGRMKQVASTGDCEQVLALLLIVLNHSASIQETKDRAARLRTELEAQLTPTQIEAIQTQAREKTFDAVVEDLLK